MPRFAAAPWSTAVKVVSAVATLVLLGLCVPLYRAVPRGTRVPFAETFGTVMVALPALILLVALLLVVRGYRFDGTTLLVERLVWNTRVELAGLDRAWHDPAAMCRSLRIFGNGGLYAVNGLFQNSALGRYRAFVTDPKRAVVLRSASRVVVVSPADSQAFLEHVRAVFPGARSGAS